MDERGSIVSRPLQIAAALIIALVLFALLVSCLEAALPAILVVMAVFIAIGPPAQARAPFLASLSPSRPSARSPPSLLYS